MPPGHRLLVCSGQLGIAPDASVPDDPAAQAELCFENIAAILASAGMSLDDVVKINTYVTHRAYLQPYMTVRDRHFAAEPPASTLMIVTGFANRAFKIEIEVIAAKPAADAAGST